MPKVRTNFEDNYHLQDPEYDSGDYWESICVKNITTCLCWQCETEVKDLPDGYAGWDWDDDEENWRDYV